MASLSRVCSWLLILPFVCGDNLEANSLQEDQHILCCFWASQGQCETNEAWMLSNCPRSCHPTDGCPVNQGGSSDLHPECCPWAIAGQCQSNSEWMAVNCNSACETPDTCPQLQVEPTPVVSDQSFTVNEETVNLEDSNILCCFWTWDGQCESNPSWMHENCPIACANKQQCDSKDKAAYLNSLQQNVATLTSVAVQHQIPEPDSQGESGVTQQIGVDNNRACCYWASIGQCQLNPSHMLVECPSACSGFCATSEPDPTPEPTTKAATLPKTTTTTTTSRPLTTTTLPQTTTTSTTTTTPLQITTTAEIIAPPAPVQILLQQRRPLAVATRIQAAPPQRLPLAPTLTTKKLEQLLSSLIQPYSAVSQDQQVPKLQPPRVDAPGLTPNARNKSPQPPSFAFNSVKPSPQLWASFSTQNAGVINRPIISSPYLPPILSSALPSYPIAPKLPTNPELADNLLSLSKLNAISHAKTKFKSTPVALTLNKPIIIQQPKVQIPQPSAIGAFSDSMSKHNIPKLVEKPRKKSPSPPPPPVAEPAPTKPNAPAAPLAPTKAKAPAAPLPTIQLSLDESHQNHVNYDFSGPSSHLNGNLGVLNSIYDIWDQASDPKNTLSKPNLYSDTANPAALGYYPSTKPLYNYSPLAELRDLKDSNEYWCCFWASRGLCQKHPYRMAFSCAKTCAMGGCINDPTRACEAAENCAIVREDGTRMRQCQCMDDLAGRTCGVEPSQPTKGEVCFKGAFDVVASLTSLST